LATVHVRMELREEIQSKWGCIVGIYDIRDDVVSLRIASGYHLIVFNLNYSILQTSAGPLYFNP
jgi:hypothetical protein